MKVVEKETDRRAEAHIYVEGRVKEVAEYGEYVDPVDKAIGCYVPVEEGDKVKIGGRFSGTTLTIAFDAVVDSVLRKSRSYSAKAVSKQSQKKIDTELFLYKTTMGIIDTDLLVTPIIGVAATQGDGAVTIGTLELRVYITRQLGVSHTLTGITKYDNIQGHNIEDEEDEAATYKKIAPTFRMGFEENCAPLEKAKANGELRRTEARRPGSKPWVIFRFHYRSKGILSACNLMA